MKLYIVRHGETDWNIERRLQGRTDIALNQNGVQLAGKTAQGLREVPFELAFSSPTKRAMETANIILGDRKTTKLIEDERLLEISFGEYEGLRISKEHYEIPDPEFSAFFHNPDNYNPPSGGETIEQMMQRAKSFLVEITQKEQWKDKTILVVTHGVTIRALICAATGAHVSKFWGDRVPPNCSVSIIECLNGIYDLIQENKEYR